MRLYNSWGTWRRNDGNYGYDHAIHPRDYEPLRCSRMSTVVQLKPSSMGNEMRVGGDVRQLSPVLWYVLNVDANACDLKY